MSLQVFEQALLHLLEGCRAVKFRNEDGSTGRVSPAISSAFTLQLQSLLKTMLGAALWASKSSSGGGSAPSRSRKSGDRNEVNGSSPSKAHDVGTLKKMYGSALKLAEGKDLGILYNMWHS